jgi:hypothetical protein
MSENPVGWFVGLLLFIVGFIVVGVIVEGAISDAFQQAADQIGGVVPVVVALILLASAATGIIASVGGLSDRLNR